MMNWLREKLAEQIGFYDPNGDMLPVDIRYFILNKGVKVMAKQSGAMLAQVRQQTIAELVQRMGNITVNDLCARFNVSPATIRNDLRSLENRSVIKRTHGGAISTSKMVYELSTVQKEVRSINEKRAIARAAAEFIEEGDAIALDSGTTTFELARLLVNIKNLTVVTNDLQIASWLEQNTSVNIMLAGGLVRRNFRCTTGQSALEMLSMLHVDKAFIAVNGVSIKSGLTTPTMDMACIKKQMIDSADKVILLADSSKIGRTAFVTYAPVSVLDVMITDEFADSSFVDSLRSTGVNVVCAKVDDEGR